MQTQGRKYFHPLFDGQGTGALYTHFSKISTKKHYLDNYSELYYVIIISRDAAGIREKPDVRAAFVLVQGNTQQVIRSWWYFFPGLPFWSHTFALSQHRPKSLQILLQQTGPAGNQLTKRTVFGKSPTQYRSFEKKKKNMIFIISINWNEVWLYIKLKN